MCVHGALSLQIKTIQEAYLPDLAVIYQRAASKVQQVSFFSKRVVCMSSRTVVPARVSMQDRFYIAKESHTNLVFLLSGGK